MHHPTPRRARPLLLSVLLAAALAPTRPGSASPRQDPEPPADGAARAACPGAGPRVKLGNMRAVVVTSRLRLRGNPTPQVIEASYAFPDRLRVVRRPEDDRDRWIFYRCGEAVYRATGKGTSLALEGAARVDLLRQFALRRCAQLWPDGARWKREGEALRLGLGPVGHVEAAELDAAGRPAVLRSFDARGEAQETLRVNGWREVEGRHWPSLLTLSVRGAVVAEEELLAVDASVDFIDAFFVPTDRRGLAGADDSGRIYALDLQAAVTKHVPLEDDLDWAAALVRAEGLAGEQAEAGRPVRTRLQLDARARPVAVLLDLVDGRGAPRAGWKWGRAAAALGQFLTVSEVPSPQAVRRLRRAAAGSGSQPGLLFARIVAGKRGGTELVLVLERIR